ncbi:putative sel1-like repeat-containing protein [Acanthamoeba polyphaga mimivirus]|nr:putative sel1-like repeat-containing protein [Mimivirus reunion]WMV61355.1 putative sel1-like repeat-containing protein [Mimivirus sp.]WMV62332.1 putative sel1-like repeat-containing protein [Acanthamoeba polyphaga mimivirus]WMV63309.1 putative sel1-like repeat-containing protein [Mimivirus sp.]
MDYKHVDIQKLIELAKYDNYAQEEIVERMIVGQVKHDLWKNINPFDWENLFEKCYSNPKYVFVLLCAYKSIFLCKIDPKIPTSNTIIYLEKIHPIVKQQAKNCDVLSQNNLGFMYEEGIGTEIKINKAKMWYTLSANQGLSFTQYNLGYYYYNKAKYEKSINYFQKSAQSGYYLSNFMLAETYLKLSIPNFNEAIKNYLLAANQGCNISQYRLGMIYFEGKYVNTDMNQAYKWFKLSAKQGNYFSQYGLGRVYYSMDSTKYNCQKAINCFIKSANCGHIYAQKKLIEYYEINNNIAEMIYWCVKSSDVDKIKKYIKINENIENTSDIVYFDLVRKNLEDVGSDILYKCQLLIIQNKYFWKDNVSLCRVKLCEKLENIILKFIDWTNKLQNNSLLLLSCLSFIDDNHNVSIRHHQHTTGLIPYVKQHEFRNKKFITFDKENVSFVNEIIDITNGTDMNEWFESLQFLKLNYQNLMKTSMNSSRIYKDLILIQNLETDIEKYCELMFDEIEYGVYDRNRLFIENREYNMAKLFDN